MEGLNSPSKDDNRRFWLVAALLGIVALLNELGRVNN
jgi:hypothetical protein